MILHQHQYNERVPDRGTLNQMLLNHRYQRRTPTSSVGFNQVCRMHTVHTASGYGREGYRCFRLSSNTPCDHLRHPSVSGVPPPASHLLPRTIGRPLHPGQRPLLPSLSSQVRLPWWVRQRRRLQVRLRGRLGEWGAAGAVEVRKV